VTEKKCICEEINCPYLISGTDEVGEWVTCTANKCPYSKEYIAAWHREESHEEETGDVKI